jgi:hypothetical protein
VTPKVRELALIVIVACFVLALAWAHDADFFAIFFAAAAAIAIVEAVRRSVSEPIMLAITPRAATTIA